MPGPIFRLEMVASARRRRTFVLRSVYGLGLLAVVGSVYRVVFPEGGTGSVPAGDVRRFGRALFEVLAVSQGAAVVVLAPAMAAGAVAGEAQRKTLDDLLTTDLSAAEILAGKAAARLSQVAALLLAGFPALLVAADLGGLGPWAAFGALAATLSTAGFLAGLAVLASTQARSTRGALNATLTAALTWLIVPGSVDVLMPRSGAWGQALYAWVGPVNAWVAPSSPFAVWLSVARGTAPVPGEVEGKVLTMIALQLAFGLAWLGLAAACLRPTARGGARRVRGRLRGRVGRAPSAARSRPPCGDDPMLWKELVVPRVPVFYRPLGLVVGLALGGLLLWSTFAFAAPAFAESRGAGYGVAASGSARAGFLVYLRVVATGVYLVFALGVASDAAAGMTSEREKDTWISLLATPLAGAEIVRAKLIGAVWGTRQTALVFAALALTGALAGSVHPLGLLAMAAEVAAFTGFAGALGTFVSLRSASTPRSVGLTTACLVGFNGVPLLLASPAVQGRPMAHLGCTPWVVAASLVSFGDVGGVPSSGELGVLSDRSLSALWAGQGAEMLATCVLTTVGYAAAGWVLYRASCRGFDAALDRPPLTETGANPPGRPTRSRRAVSRARRRVSRSGEVPRP